ncbi:hypothetical protein MCEL_45010 [Mycolicibacterium celeriflavum]|uniref:Uncharacterized protein n=1 Tax=Mycolicibacterium celeriflavum TaxID=1249101 RepID=A0A7I7RQE3_MYCCF|nr:hypothetical protein MCEL_45010 [Mycolicibacterium celeriflavum]
MPSEVAPTTGSAAGGDGAAARAGTTTRCSQSPSRSGSSVTANGRAAAVNRNGGVATRVDATGDGDDGAAAADGTTVNAVAVTAATPADRHARVRVLRSNRSFTLPEPRLGNQLTPAKIELTTEPAHASTDPIVWGLG